MYGRVALEVRQTGIMSASEVVWEVAFLFAALFTGEAFCLMSWGSWVDECGWFIGWSVDTVAEISSPSSAAFWILLLMACCISKNSLNPASGKGVISGSLGSVVVPSGSSPSCSSHLTAQN